MRDRIWRVGAALGCLLAACGGRAETQSPGAGGSETNDPPGPLRPAPSGGATSGGATSGGTTWEGGGTGNVGGTSSGGDIGWNDFAGTSNGGTSNGGTSGGGTSTSNAGTGGIETPEQMELAALRLGVIGSWVGTRTDWLGGAPCSVSLVFTADGHYSAHSVANSCVVFYYGTDDDNAAKTYLLDDVTAAGEGSGEVVIYFSPGDTNTGILKHVALSADGQQLSFESWKDGYGPLKFSLVRQ